MATTTAVRDLFSEKIKFIFVGLVFLMAGLFVFIIAGETRLVCDRTAGECQLEEIGRFGTEKDVVSLDTVEGARLDESREKRTGKPRYRAIIDTDKGSASLSHRSSQTPDSHQILVDRVNEFLDDRNQQRVEVVDDGGIIYQLMPLIFAVVGFLFLIVGLRKEGTA